MRGARALGVAVLLLTLQIVGLGACLVEAADECADAEAGTCTACCSVCSCCPHAFPPVAAPRLAPSPQREASPPVAAASVVEPDPAEILHVPKRPIA